MSPLQAAPVLEREYDPEIKDMADYIHNYKVDSELAVRSSPKQKRRIETNMDSLTPLVSSSWIPLDAV